MLLSLIDCIGRVLHGQCIIESGPAHGQPGAGVVVADDGETLVSSDDRVSHLGHQ